MQPMESATLADARRNDLYRASCRDQGSGSTSGTPTPKNASTTRIDQVADSQDVPHELMTFVKACSVTEAAVLLGVARPTIYRLRNGYWPRDDRRLRQAWSRFKGREQRATAWFLRRVRGGAVQHAGQRFLARDLAGRDGELVALARASDGGLIGVALDAPSSRFALRPDTPAEAA